MKCTEPGPSWHGRRVDTCPFRRVMAQNGRLVRLPAASASAARFVPEEGDE
jgi:hypothetical protein